jgi:acyl carrier protein
MTANRHGVRGRIIGLVKQVLGTGDGLDEPSSGDRQLSELGVSSLKMVNLMLAVEMEFDLTIPQEEITPENFHSIASIEAMLHRLLP